MMKEQYLWVEKYRPKTIKDCILPPELKETLQAIVDSGEMQNLMLSGGPGCGKTTAAQPIVTGKQRYCSFIITVH